ncbi:DUF4064 domain-containing protein [Barrientosiimonas marina]|uniref:DUF4064 domain-containing protein n=1 Tax=Lentibacillus kimchii TaxID=1542911 RepID=A0ABW2UU34_9BACI
MSRTGEIVLSVIGALVYGFFSIAGGLMVWVSNNEAVLNEATDEMKQQPGIAPGELDVALEGIQGGGWFLVILTVISVIMGIISIVFMKGNSKPKAAGIMLIVTAAVSTLITFGALIFGGIFYLIAGIMCLARKAPQSTITME